MRPFAAAAPLALVLLAACQPAAEAGAEDAWARLPAASGRPGAAYFTLTGGAKGAELVAVESPAANRAELHEMRNDGGVMRMGAVAKIAVPAGGEVTLAPGGYHVMLFGLQPGATPGGTIPLTLRFADGRDLPIEAKLVGAGDPAPE